MGHRWTLCSLLVVILGRAARLADDDRRVDRVVFGLQGETFYFPNPIGGDWTARRWGWPEHFDIHTKMFMLGDNPDRTGFAVRNFSPEDQGRRYWVETYTEGNQKIKTHYRAVLAKRIEVDVGATLTIHIPPEISRKISTIIWKYTPTETTKSTAIVDVLRHGTFKGRARVDSTTGKLSVSDWRWRDDGFFTAEISGAEFAANFKVESMVRVKTGDDLHLDPEFASSISQFSWYRDNTLVVEFNAANGTVVYHFAQCATNTGNCNFDFKTGKLTVKSWQHSGVFTMKINDQMQLDTIKVLGDVIFVPLVSNMQLTPRPVDNLRSILWKHGGNLAAEYRIEDDILDYWTICNNNNCVLDRNGMLTVKTWGPFNSITFKVELNDRTQPYEYAVVKKLDEYEISLQKKRIDQKKTNLICAGDLDGAGPIEYLWKSHGTSNWVKGTKIMETKNILVGNGLVYEYDACKIKNPVSEREIMLDP